MPRNLGTFVLWRLVEDPSTKTNQFQHVLWSFFLSIEGCQSCRPVITIEGTHHMESTGGRMLVAVRVDANDQLFLFAPVIVESEDNDTWVGSWLALG